MRRPKDCWPWAAGTYSNGYGQFDNRGAHCVAWELSNGCQVPDGRVVRHTCHNKLCCNPDHLLVGTNADNSQDMTEADRQAKGVHNGRNKLSEDDVRLIRRYLKQGTSQSKIAELFGVSQNCISHIHTRKQWTHVT